MPIDKVVDKVFPVFNLPEAIKLRLNKHYTYQMIADHFGMKRPTVHTRLRRFMSILDTPDSAESYNEVRQKLFTAAEIKLLEKIVDSKTLKDASLNNAAFAFDKIYQANRIERGLNTDPSNSDNPVNKQILVSIENVIINQASKPGMIDVTPVKEIDGVDK